MCTGRTHARSSALAYLLITGSARALAVSATLPWSYLPGPRAVLSLATGTVLTAGAGVTPDIDLPQSTVSRSLGFLTVWFAKGLQTLGLKHRHATHSLLGAAVFTAVAWVLTVLDHPGEWGIPLPAQVAAGVLAGDRVVLALFLTVILASALCVLKVTGHAGDLAALALAAGMAWTGWGLNLLPAAVAIGCGTHIAGDMLTDVGCPLLWGVTSRHFFLTWPPPVRFTTDHWFERGPLTWFLTAALGWVVLLRLGAHLPALGLHLLEAYR